MALSPEEIASAVQQIADIDAKLGEMESTRQTQDVTEWLAIVKQRQAIIRELGQDE